MFKVEKAFTTVSSLEKKEARQFCWEVWRHPQHSVAKCCSCCRRVPTTTGKVKRPPHLNHHRHYYYSYHPLTYKRKEEEGGWETRQTRGLMVA
jgi:hypothetical protein